MRCGPQSAKLQTSGFSDFRLSLKPFGGATHQPLERRRFRAKSHAEAMCGQQLSTRRACRVCIVAYLDCLPVTLMSLMLISMYKVPWNTKLILTSCGFAKRKLCSSHALQSLFKNHLSLNNPIPCSRTVK